MGGYFFWEKNSIVEDKPDRPDKWAVTFFVKKKTLLLYRVFLKKVLHKREEKMREKMKMTQQKDKNMIQVQ